MTKLKPHEIFMAEVESAADSLFMDLFIKHTDGHCCTLEYVKRNEDLIKARFSHYAGVEWPDDVLVVDCWKKVVADEKLR